MKCEACGHQNVEGARFCASCGALLPAHASGPDPMIGQVVGGRYRITGVLGEGGMGVVYVGEQQMGSTIRKVAVKTLHSHLSKDPAVLARFHRECGTVAQLEHANTIKFYDFGATADGTLYIAMEFVRGEPLNKLIEQGPIPPERALNILRQVSGALDEAHKLGVIHRDLKPENIILTERAGETDFVKVLDFGIAARTESADAQKEQKLTQQGMVLGTPPYMSPEQFTGKALDSRSDIYSLGVMAYEMLTGKLPFEADTPWQWATQHMTVQPTPFEVSAPSQSIPDSARHAILKSLSKNRDDRQTTVREFFSELSGGSRMTIDAPALHAGGGSTGTAAMAAAPDFAAAAGAPPHGSPGGHHAVAPTAGMPPAAVRPASTPNTGPATAVPVVPPPPVRPSAGGGKGLLFGLIAVGALLAIGLVIVALRSLKPSDDGQTLTNPFSSSSGVATIAPQVDTAVPVSSVSAGPVASTASTPEKPSQKTGTGTGTGTGGGTGTGTGPTNAAACDQCISAAAGGNVPGAAAAYRRCNDEGKKQRCSARAKSAAPAAAQAAAMNGNCGQAKAIAAAARVMGAGSGGLDAATRSCKVGSSRVDLQACKLEYSIVSPK